MPAAPARAGGISTGSHLLDGVLVALSAAAVALPAIVVDRAPPIMPQPKRVRAMAQAAPVVPPETLPPVEPTAFRELPPDEARAFNAAVPFVTGPNPAARPFRFSGDLENRTRATDCLAAAVLYEAGDDARGQRAVAQVVLNRLRHPAFPKTVCGVVFQGSERSTGCQFTFTCDGALARAYPQPFWDRARSVAAQALAGSVYAPVGYATHYHTNWVVPYWQSSLDKIAAVDTHLFFRWTGWWGTPPAFRRTPESVEPRILQLAPYSDAHKLPEVLAVEQEVAALLPGTLTATGPLPQPSADDPETFLVTLDGASHSDDWPRLAMAACGERARCKFLGWAEATQVPVSAAAANAPAALATMRFSYLRDRSVPFERALWNCQQVPRPPAQCMRRAASPPGPVATPAVRLRMEPAAPLSGVRRKGEPAAQPTPGATPKAGE
ncbi:cell wall hydrolase [Sphingomonas sp. VNH70]|uniref:cell wall hydrolase n=1 Tax=Sphingomonas silueang TaxID=3156617 RepID=UPI0032B3EDF9